MPIPDAGSYNHHFALGLSIDLVGDLDLDIAFLWDRANAPAPDSQGLTPFKDDFQTTLGLHWAV